MPIKNIAINGILGKMGRQVLIAALAEPSLKVIAGIDRRDDAKIWEVPVHKDFSDLNDLDLIIDYSTPEGLMHALDFALENKIRIVSGTTGLTEEHKQRLQDAGNHIPILWSPNMSPGINVTVELAQFLSRYLPDYDIELVERHHRRKIDSPSGTALAILDRIKQVKGTPENRITYGRDKGEAKREIGEIGAHAIRGGGVVGEHTIYFMGNDEEIVITHRAFSRQVFALGTIRAIFWLITAENGFYNILDTFTKE